MKMDSLLCVVLAVCGVFGAVIGGSKNRAGTGLLLGLFLGPIGLLIVLLLSDASKKSTKPTCATCGNETIVGAARCPACGNDPRKAVLAMTCLSCKGVIQPGDPRCPHCNADRHG